MEQYFLSGQPYHGCPRRATGYSPSATGFQIDMSNWERVGDGAVQTCRDLPAVGPEFL